MADDLVYFSFYVFVPFLGLLRLIWHLFLAYVYFSRHKSKFTLMKW